ncbi:MAG: hypothetical protein ACKVHP_06975, partial [Verrucomicrobiales bacterium]
MNKLTNPRIVDVGFDGDSLTVSGEGAQLSVDRSVQVAALTLTEGGALVSDGSTFTPKVSGTVTIHSNASIEIP